MRETLDFYKNLDIKKMLSQLVIKTWDKQILFSRDGGYIISTAPGLVFECIILPDAYKDKNNRSPLFNLYWALIHGDIARLELNRHKQTKDDDSIIANALKLKCDWNGIYYPSMNDILLPDDYLRFEGTDFQLMCIGVYDSGELVSSYDWRREKKSSGRSTRKKRRKNIN